MDEIPLRGGGCADIGSPSLIADCFGVEISSGSWLAVPGIVTGRPTILFARVTAVAERSIAVERFSIWDGHWIKVDEEFSSRMFQGCWVILFEYLPNGLRSLFVNKPSRALTQTQLRIYQYLEDFIAMNGFPPTRAEISKEFGYKSNNSAEDHLQKMAKKGVIEMSPVSRGIKLLWGRAISGDGANKSPVGHHSAR